MKKHKRFMSVFLVLVLGFSLSLPAFATDVIDYYSDVSEDNWYIGDVRYLWENDIRLDGTILPGSSNWQLRPEEPISRSSFVWVLGHMHGIGWDSGFQSQKWYDKYKDCDDAVLNEIGYQLAWADTYGIVNGVGNDLFNPEGHLTREEMAAIAVRYLTVFFPDAMASIEATATNVVPSFSDAAQISSWAVDHVEQCRKMGILHGDQAGRVNPQGTLSRAETAVVLANLHKAVSPWMEARPVVAEIELSCAEDGAKDGWGDTTRMFVDYPSKELQVVLKDSNGNLIENTVGLYHFKIFSAPEELKLDFDPLTGKVAVTNLDELDTCDADLFSDELIEFFSRMHSSSIKIYCISDFDPSVADSVVIKFHPYPAAVRQECENPPAEYRQKVADEFFRLMNEERATKGLAPVIQDDELQKAADIRAQELYYCTDHVRPDGSNYSTILSECGIHSTNLGENVQSQTYIPTAFNYASPEKIAKAIFDAYKESPGHYANMMHAGSNVHGATQIYYTGVLYNAYLFYTK